MMVKLYTKLIAMGMLLSGNSDDCINHYFYHLIDTLKIPVG